MILFRPAQDFVTAHSYNFCLIIFMKYIPIMYIQIILLKFIIHYLSILHRCLTAYLPKF